MYKLFTELSAYTDLGKTVAGEIDEFFDALLRRYSEVSPRELSHMVTQVVTCAESSAMVERTMNFVRAREDRKELLRFFDAYQSGALVITAQIITRFRNAGFLSEDNRITDEGRAVLREYRGSPDYSPSL